MVGKINIGVVIRSNKSFKSTVKSISEYVISNLENLVEKTKSNASRLKAFLLLLIVLVFFQLLCPFILNVLRSNIDKFIDS